MSDTFHPLILMQNNRIFHARRIFAVLGTLAALALAGCASTTVTNMTPSTLPVNPSQTYTITARVTPSASNVIPNSETVQIIIGNQAYKMTKTPNLDNIYEFDYKASAGVTQIAYYFLVQYNTSDSGIVSPREDYSPLQHATIVDRDTTGGLSANRGPAGARIAITGRGFTTNDSVFFDSTAVRPTFESQNSLSFFVPSLEAGRTYAVSVGSAPGKMNVGSFLIDSSVNNAAGTATTGGYAIATNASASDANANYTTTTTTYTTSTTAYATGGATMVFGAVGSSPASSAYVNAAPQTAALSATPASTAPMVGNNISITQPTNDITVSPEEITIYTDDYVVLKFIIPRKVTGQPLLIDVTTDIPDSVIMPEVYVKVGSNVGSVNLKGGKPGKGHLFAKASGYSTRLTIPITVK